MYQPRLSFCKSEDGGLLTNKEALIDRLAEYFEKLNAELQEENGKVKASHGDFGNRTPIEEWEPAEKMER